MREYRVEQVLSDSVVVEDSPQGYDVDAGASGSVSDSAIDLVVVSNTINRVNSHENAGDEAVTHEIGRVSRSFSQ